MVYLGEIRQVVSDSYKALAEMQYLMSRKELVSGDEKFFDPTYTLTTKIIANLEYLELLNLGRTHDENTEIENILFSLTEIISKIKSQWV